MAKRLLFKPSNKENGFVKEIEIKFKWASPVIYGKAAARNNVESMHAECEDILNIKSSDLLEVSGASQHQLGRDLSAMNLGIDDVSHTGHYRKNKFVVEALYQGSKVFERGGPHHEIYTYTGFAAKKKLKEKYLGSLIGFDYFGTQYPIDPHDCFYNWLYATVLCCESNREFLDKICNDCNYSGFTDIYFNHSRQYACQARALAIFCGMANEDYTMNQITDFDEHFRVRQEVT